MKANAQTTIWTEKLVLVPYKRSHVPKYHGWMQSEELQQLTASEPLSLDQEYDMQQTWLEDSDKCTFIVLDRALHERSADEQASMIGDTNLFLLGAGAAEVEVMIAERWARGSGRGRQAAAAMLRYGVETLRLTRFEAKIGFDNAASQRMFAALGFGEVGQSDVFREVTLEAVVTADWRCSVERLTPGYRADTEDHGMLGGDHVPARDGELGEDEPLSGATSLRS